MAKYNKKNLASSTLASAITNVATTLTVQSGDGAKMPATPFYATLTDYGVISTTANSEIVQVTAISTDTLTISRGQRSTSGRAFAAGAVISNGVFTQDIDDLTQDDIPDGTTNKAYSATDKTKLAGISTGADVTATALGLAIDGATSKTTPVDADELPLSDSAASFGLKKLTWGNLKAAIKSYYDAVTSTLTNKTLTEPLISGSASAPSTPASGSGKIAGAGTGAVRPKWINSSGTLETLLTDLGSTVQSFTNTNTGGGTFYYTTIAGMKIFWGQMVNSYGTAAVPTWYVDLPSGFFTTVDAAFATPGPNNTTNNMYTLFGGGGITATQLAVNFYASTTTSAMKVNVLAIGR